MRARWAVTLATAMSLLLAAAAAPAWATDPVQLGSTQVLDESGVLSSSELSTVEARLEQLSDETTVDLWVVYVPEFTDPSDSEQWAIATAEANGLGPNQYLLAVATQSRQFYLSADSTGPVSVEDILLIEQQLVQPALADGDWAGAAIAAADGLTQAVGGGTPGEDPADEGAGGFGAIVLILLLIAGAALVVWLIVRARRKGKQPALPGAPASPLDEIDTAELRRRAASALVQTDDAVKTSAQELEFAKAQFGESATTEFAEALATAKASLDEAFSLQQKLDDEKADTDAEVREWSARILSLLDAANEGLDDKAADFDELRKLEQNAPEALARVRGQRETALGEITRADSTLAGLAATYAPEALATVIDNPAQARERIAFADEQLAQAQGSLAEGRTGEAAAAIRAAEESVAQATLLEDAIDTLGADLVEGERQAAALIVELEGDIAAASALADPDGRIAGVVAQTRAQLDAAKTLLASTQRRPLAALQALEAANAQIDALVQGARDAEAQAQRSRQLLGQTMLRAQAQVSAAEDYITARRGAIGAEARTRLAEAGATLVHAQQLQSSDPVQSLQFAERAEQLAAQAIQHAQSDVGSFGGGSGFGGGGGQGGVGSGGNGMLGAILGGIVVDSLLSGGSSRSRGGTGGIGGLGGMRGGSSSGRSSGGFSPGSFGGGGTRARRGGGRF